jgi:novobiocin biosynthesis protein NovU/D-mycarose 3-C-methyltransferase
MPLANAFLATPEEARQEPVYPLAVAACSRCGFVQLTFVVPAEQLYRHYLYVSSTSEAVRRYAAALAKRLAVRYALAPSDLVVELGSNDGLVLREFQRQGVQVLGVEPARNIAAVANAHGVPTVEEFFSSQTAGTIAREGKPAKVILGRHVFAHLDDLHDFFEGVDRLLADDGVVLIEVPYLGTLIDGLEFDTIYHEHLSYVALQPMQAVCARHGFEVVDAESVPLHGGSVLFAIQRTGSGRPPSERVARLARQEQQRRLTQAPTLQRFARRVTEWKQRFEACLEQLERSGAGLVGYGAAAKANTLLNFCPSAARRLRVILDRSPHKHGRFTPGTHLPVVDASAWDGDGATHMVILAWNFKDEIMAQMRPFAKRGGRFVIPIPQPEVV